MMDEVQKALNYLNVSASTIQNRVGLDEFLRNGTQLINEFEEQLVLKIQSNSLLEIEKSLSIVEDLVNTFGRFFPKGSIDNSTEFNLMHYYIHYQKYNQKLIIEGFERDEAAFSGILNKETTEGIRDAREEFDNEKLSFRRLILPFVRHQLRSLQGDVLQYIVTHGFSSELTHFSKGSKGLEDFEEEITKQVFHTLLTYEMDEVKSGFLWHILGGLIHQREQLKRRYFPGMFYERSDLDLIDRLLRSKGIINANDEWEGILIKGRELHPYLNGILALVEALLTKRYINKKIALGKELTSTEIVRAFCMFYGIVIGERTARDKAQDHPKLVSTLLSIIPSRSIKSINNTE